MILDDIISHKKRVLSELKSGRGFEDAFNGLKARAEAAPKPRDFEGALAPREGAGAVRIIAEVKKASPSKGIIREDFDPLSIASAYEKNGAAAISVLTDEKYFQGSIEYLFIISAYADIPVLRKDFIVDEYQVYEARAAGADAVLLIAEALNAAQLLELLSLTTSLGMAALVEAHDEAQLKKAADVGARIIGINNRDLNTFKVDTDTTIRLVKKIPGDRVVVAESGINTHEDIEALRSAGVAAFLVGESLMRESDIGKKLRELRGLG